MNLQEKGEIKKLLSEGLGYKKIADSLGLPINTVKSFCYRNSLCLNQSAELCKQCKTVIRQAPKRKKKLFCSDLCRMRWWNTHQELMKHSSVISFTCPQCKGSFESYGKREQKFCSRACYAKYRKKELL